MNLKTDINGFKISSGRGRRGRKCKYKLTENHHNIYSAGSERELKQYLKEKGLI